MIEYFMQLIVFKSKKAYNYFYLIYFVYHNVFAGNFVCHCGVATDISKRLINCTLFCEQFDEVIASFFNIYICYILA